MPRRHHPRVAADSGASPLSRSIARRPITSLGYPGARLDGIEATRRIVAERPATRVVALTTFDLDEYVYAAIHAGVSGFLLKDVAPVDLVYAARLVARGESILAPSLTTLLLERFARTPAAAPQVAGLTERERSVLVLGRVPHICGDWIA
jgi:DNA-binding NarL/FixJ family response regulator